MATGLVVRKVTLGGVQNIGWVRGSLNQKKAPALRDNGRGIGAKIYTNQGITTARLDDFAGVPLSQSLNPRSFEQTFVGGPVILRAHELLSSNRKVYDRLQPSTEETIDFSKLAFGLNKSDVMYFARIKKGGDWELVPATDSFFPFEEFPINPAAEVLHYCQTCFEGAKAYMSEKGRIVSFRLGMNAERMMRSAERIALTPVPAKYHLGAVHGTVLANERLLAPPGLGAAMYVRAFHFGNGPQIGVAPAPEETFIVIVSPVGPYFKGGFATQKMLVEEEFARSAAGLMGSVKDGANYAGSLLPGSRAKAKGYAEVIYLDVIAHQYVEEVGAANAFFVKDGVLYTPRLSGTILPGITRDSVITLARDMGIKVVDDQNVSIDFAMTADEAFCTGTAAVISPVGSITKGEHVAVFNNSEVGPTTGKLYRTLVDIQEERIPDPYGWVHVIR